jgi:hypothetical protein
VLCLTSVRANIGALSLRCTRNTLQSHARDDQDQQNGDRDDAEDRTHQAPSIFSDEIEAGSNMG